VILFGSERWESLVGFRFLGLRYFLLCSMYFVSFSVFYMFQIYQDLDVAFTKKN
jgi:hypothetical protein